MTQLLILYSTVTGTAEDIAETLALRAAAQGLSPSLRCLSSFPIATLPLHARVIFVVSTWGDGEFPPSALAAWRFLARAALPPSSLSAVRAAVFGLGDRGYAKYNAAARKLWARLAQLGASPLCELGLGDAREAGGAWRAMEEWLAASGLWAALGCGGGAGAAAAPPPRLRYRASLLTGDAAARAAAAEGALPCGWPFLPVEGLLAGGFSAAGGAAPFEGLGGAGAGAGCGGGAPPPLLATVAANERLTAPGWSQDVRQLTMGEWRCSASGAPVAPPRWGAGDVAVVAVENPPPAVAALAAWLGLPLDAPLRLAREDDDDDDDDNDAEQRLTRGGEGDGGGCGVGDGDGERVGTADAADAALAAVPPPPQPPALAVPLWATAAGGALPSPRAPAPLPPAATLRALLGAHLDICGRPRRSALAALAHFARDAEEAAKLRELAGAAGAALYDEYVVREARSWVDVLLDFSSLRPLPVAALLELVPRLRPRHYSIASAPPAPLQLCVAVLAFTTRYGRQKAGVASTWLAAAAVGARVALWLRRGAWRPPPRGAPLLLVGPGTGIAPLRAVVQEEEARAAAADAATGAASMGAPPPPPPPPPSRVHLFFGCRHAAEDHLYGEEMAGRVARSAAARCGGVAPWAGVDTYDTAFSRDAPPRRVYVQALLQRRCEEVRAALEAGAHVFIAGAANGMPEDVRSVLAGALGDGGAARLAAMEREGRVVVEAWS
jgi:sulfite reductase alpha subunit-like flavoprotein